jgi:hypothetical protein
MTTTNANPLYPRKRAKLQGATVYHRPAACTECGTHARYVSSAACVECDRKAKADRLADPATAERVRAQGAARAAAFRARRNGNKPAGGRVPGGAEFGDILG